MPERLLNVHIGHDPVEMWFFIGTTLGAIAAIAAPSPAVVLLFPPWVLWLWYGNFAIWSIVGLAGVLPRPVKATDARGFRVVVRRLHLEQVGSVGVSLCCVSMGAASVAFTGIHAASGSLWLFALGIGFAHRLIQISRDIKLMNRVFEEVWPTVVDRRRPPAPRET